MAKSRSFIWCGMSSTIINCGLLIPLMWSLLNFIMYQPSRVFNLTGSPFLKLLWHIIRSRRNNPCALQTDLVGMYHVGADEANELRYTSTWPPLQHIDSWLLSFLWSGSISSLGSFNSLSISTPQSRFYTAYQIWKLFILEPPTSRCSLQTSCPWYMWCDHHLVLILSCSSKSNNLVTHH